MVKIKKVEPVWAGPCGGGPQGGVTQSLLSRFIVCRERFRILTIEGLAPTPAFSPRMDYGTMWHVCEEALASGKDWQTPLKKEAQRFASLYSTQGEEVLHWYNVCKTQFPVYVKYWEKHPDVVQRTPILQEEVFDVPYILPSDRVVRLRGKWDSIDLIGKGKNALIYLQENKTKGDIDERLMVRQLTFDLQTMFYLTAFQCCQEYARDGLTFDYPTKDILPVDQHWGSLVGIEKPIGGIRYNVIRRPLSGGKHSIRQHAPTKSNPDGESKVDFYKRLGGLIEEDAEFFFMRWKVEISKGDVGKFQRESFNPILEQLCDWYHAVAGRDKPWWPTNPWDNLHYRLPYGVYNPMLEGKASELDEYLHSGSTLGLSKVDSLFGELDG